MKCISQIKDDSRKVLTLFPSNKIQFLVIMSLLIMLNLFILTFEAFAIGGPVVSNLNGDVLNYAEDQNQTLSPALLDASGNATVTSSGWNVGGLRVEFTAGSTTTQDGLYFGNSGTGAGQINAGYSDNPTGSNTNYGYYIKYSGTVIGTWTSGGGYNGTAINMVFNSSATDAAVTALVNNLRYSNSEQYCPSTSSRTVRFTFTDASSNVTTADTTVNVTALNDAPKFMGAGFAATDFGTAEGNSANGHKIAQQADGKYVVTFDIMDTNWESHLAVARYNANGTLDSSFGTNGIYHSLLGNASPSNNIKDILIRSDEANAGKIVISTTDSDGAGDDSIVLLQLNTDGTVDTNFGTSGVCRFNAGGAGSLEEICAIAQQPDGKIVAAGSYYETSTTNRDITLWRFKADGSGLDTTFNTTGYVATEISNSYSYGYDVLVQSDGKILLAGLVHGSNNTTDAWDYGIRCYNSNGTLDTTFGTSGMAQLDYVDSHEGNNKIELQTQGANAGKIIIAGTYYTGTNNDVAIARLNSNGTLDTTFGTSGWTVFDVSENNSDTVNGLILDENDKIILSGNMGGAACVVKVSAEGSLDTTFDTDGIIMMSSLGEDPSFNGILLDSSGKILVTGSVMNAVINPLTDYYDSFGLFARLNSDGSFDPMGTSDFTEGESAIVLNSDMQLYDGELAATNYDGATLSVARQGEASVQDVFSATGTLATLTQGGNLTVDGTTIGTVTTNSGGTLLLTFNASATNTLVNNVIKKIAYRNSSATPPSSVQINMTMNDQNSGGQGTGGSLSTTVSFTINITDVVNGDSDSTVTAGTGVTEPVAIPTTATTIGVAVNVLDFKITDTGATDLLTTDITQVVVSTSGTGSFGKVTWRLNGPDVSNVTGTYDSGTNTITFSGLNISVANGGTETYTVNAYYNDNTGLTEGHTYILSVDGDSGSAFTVSGSGSQMAGAQDAVNNETGSIVSVTATKLIFGTQPASSVSGVSLTQPVVRATDAVGNIDIDFIATIALTEASAGSLSGTVSLVTTSGVATFTDVIYTAAGDQETFAITAVSDSLTSAVSDTLTSNVVATRLVFQTQSAPTTLESGQATSFTTVPTIQAVDANGTVDTGYTSDIVVSVTDPNDSIIDGTVNGLTATGDTDGSSTTVTKVASNGSATFVGLAVQYTVSGSTNTIALRATSGGLTAVNSSSITAITAPTAPNVTGTTPTNDTTPIWSWTAGGGGNGIFRYKLDDSDLSTGSTITTDLSYTPGVQADGTHTLYVQERDVAGNWSTSGSYAIAIDTTAPTAPNVTGTTPTTDTTPTWSWTAGGGGNGTYRYKLDNSDLTTGSTTTTNSNYTPEAQTDGTHTLYVQERDVVGNWSNTGSYAIVIDTLLPTVTFSVYGSDVYAKSISTEVYANEVNLALLQYKWIQTTDTPSSDWTTILNNDTVTKSTGDGIWYLHVKAVDEVDNTCYDYARFKIDNTGPENTSLTVTEAVYQPTASMVVYADDSLSGISQMSFKMDEQSWTDWETYSTTKTWSFGTNDGQHTMYARFTDIAGNVSETVSDAVYSDTRDYFVNFSADSLEIIYQGSDNASSVTQDIILPNIDGYGVGVTWNSSNLAYVTKTGEVTRPSYLTGDVDVTVTAEVYKDGITTIKIFNLTLVKLEMTDAEAISIDKPNVAIGYATGDSASSVTQNITLPLIGTNATTVTWSSSNISIISNAGVVTRPTYSLGDATVTLTATITRGSASDTKTFILTVVKRPQITSSVGETIPQTVTQTDMVEVMVNGKNQKAATSETKEVQGKTVTTVSVDQTVIEEKLKTEGNNALVVIPVAQKSDIVIGVLTGQTVKNMETKEAVLEIRTENVTYTLPASQINIDNVSEQIGNQVELKDIAVNVKISAPSQETVRIVENTANKNNYQVVVKPAEFEITCTSGNRTVDVSKFNGYVERTVAIPNGVDPSKITTGIVLNKDGTFSHVPTTIVVINGKYYAKINSLTNSTYSVIYHPLEFKDVEKHWAKNDINDMGSRLIINGVEEENFEPGRDITRAEFAAIVVRALGLMRNGTGKDAFKDVKNTDWYFDAVSIAYEYKLISGYEDGNFEPKSKITRGEAMAIVSRTMTITKLNTELSDAVINEQLAKFKDSNKIHGWAKKHVAACVKSQIIEGINSKVFANDNITRAEVATIIKRLLQKSKLI